MRARVALTALLVAVVSGCGEGHAAKTVTTTRKTPTSTVIVVKNLKSRRSVADVTHRFHTCINAHIGYIDSVITGNGYRLLVFSLYLYGQPQVGVAAIVPSIGGERIDAKEFANIKVTGSLTFTKPTEVGRITLAWVKTAMSATRREAVNCAVVAQR